MDDVRAHMLNKKQKQIYFRQINCERKKTIIILFERKKMR